MKKNKVLNWNTEKFFPVMNSSQKYAWRYTKWWCSDWGKQVSSWQVQGLISVQMMPLQYKYLLLALQAQAQTSAHAKKFFSTEDHVCGASEVSREHPSRLLFCSLSGPSDYALKHATRAFKYRNVSWLLSIISLIQSYVTEISHNIYQWHIYQRLVKDYLTAAQCSATQQAAHPPVEPGILSQ